MKNEINRVLVAKKNEKIAPKDDFLMGLAQ